MYSNDFYDFLFYVSLFMLDHLKLQYFLILNNTNMKAKLIGSITSHEKKVGKFYRPPSSQNSLKQSRKTSTKAQPQQIGSATAIQLKRSNSVGKIYSSKNVQNGEKKYQSGKISYNNLINYDEMESKLSSYLTCTIRTNGRQKYNYLGESYKPFFNERYSYQRKTLIDLQMNDNMMMNKKPLERPFYGTSEAVFKENNYANTVFARKSEQKADCRQKMPTKKSSQSKKGKQNCMNYESTLKGMQNNTKKDNAKLFSINHQEQKCELENKLKKIINSYQIKNKELGNQLHLLQSKASSEKFQDKSQKKQKKELQKKEEESLKQEQTYSPQFLSEIVSKLIEFNMKTICMSTDCQHKQTLWKSIHNQIILDQKLRLAKMLINEQNTTKILELINANRLKKLEASTLKAHAEQYDPFLIQKCTELFATNQPNLSKNAACKWIADHFVKCYEQSERHWIKNLSQQKMQCEIKSLVLQKQVVSLRKEGLSRELNLREFTRYLSTLFKANLRSRNLYLIYTKLKGLSYVGRFIELLEQKTSKISDVKKSTIQK